MRTFTDMFTDAVFAPKGLQAGSTSSPIDASVFNQSQKGIKYMHGQFSRRVSACLNRAGVTRQLLLQTGHRGSRENVSCACRLNPVDILVLLKSTSIQLFACSNPQNTKDQHRSWTWGDSFFPHVCKGREVSACWNEMSIWTTH